MLLHCYVYMLRRGPRFPGGPGHFIDYVYERTCGTEQDAKDRVAELRSRGEEALYLINHTIRGAFY